MDLLPDGRPSADPTVLADLWQMVARQGSFVNPAHVRAGVEALGNGPAWVEAILGRVPTSSRDLRSGELSLLTLAAQVDHDWLENVRARRAAHVAAQARADVDVSRERCAQDLAAWQAIAAALPVPVQVRHNWARGHWEARTFAADHIVVTAELVAGRLRRDAWTALCAVPSRARDLAHLDVDPASTYATDRVPNCRACVRRAQRLADVPVTGIVSADNH